MAFASRSFKRPHDITIDTDTSAGATSPPHSPRAPTPSQWSPLTASSVNTTFSNDTHDRDLWIPISYVQEPDESDYGSEPEWAESLTDGHNPSTGTSLISDNTKLEDMTLDQIAIRIFEISGLNGREKQIEAIHAVACLKESLILIARTSFGKSLVFNMLPLLHPRNTGIVLVVVPLKLIAEQQYEKVNKFPRARSFVYDKDHKSKLDRQRIAAGVYTHVFTSPEYILSAEFNEDICKKPEFRERLIAVAVDELHLVDDWRDFRPEFSGLHVLKSRLPPDVPYFGASATLDKDTLAVVKRDAGFEDCRIIKTSIDRPEISMHIIFIEGNQNNFEDLRRFFPINATDPYSIPKTVLYFDSKSNIQKFVRLATDVWFPEWNYPLVAKRWIAAYHADMADGDKKRIAGMFEKPDQANFPELSSSIRFLAASEAYGLGADNPDIRNICNWMIPKSKNAMTQRKGRSARQVPPGFCYLLVPRWACDKTDLLKVRKGKGSRDPLLEAYILGQNDSEYESDQSNAADSQIKPMTKAAESAYNAQQRQKQIPAYIDLINSPCNRLCELERYDDEAYVKYKENKLARPAVCCSSCNPGHIPKHRPYSESKKSDSVFHAYLTKKLTLWRDEKAREVYAGSHIPMPGSTILSDRFLRIIIQVAEFLTDRDALLRYCRGWSNRELYQNEIVSMCIGLQDQKRTDSEAYLAWRAAVAAKKETAARKKKGLPSEKETEVERSIRERKEQRDAWLISKGLSVENGKKGTKERKKNVASASNASLTVEPESQSQETSQSTGSSSFSLSTVGGGESQQSMSESQSSQLASTRSPLSAISGNVNRGPRPRAGPK